MLEEIFEATWSELSKKPMTADEREQLRVEYTEYLLEQYLFMIDTVRDQSKSFSQMYKAMFIANEIDWFSRMSAQEMLHYMRKQRALRAHQLESARDSGVDSDVDEGFLHKFWNYIYKTFWKAS